MKYGFILLIFLAGCATSTPQVINEYDSQGRVMRSTQSIDSKEYAVMNSVQAAESARAECYRSGAINPALDSHAQVAAIVAQAAGKGVDCGKGYNDALIAQEHRKAAQTETRWGFAGTALKTAGAIFVGAKVVDGVTDLGIAALGAAGNNINASEGSEIILNGSIGEGNTYSEEIGGIPLAEGEVSPVALGATPAAPVAAVAGLCNSLRAPVATDPIGTDANGDGLVCSDGNGGVTDN